MSLHVHQSLSLLTRVIVSEAQVKAITLPRDHISALAINSHPFWNTTHRDAGLSNIFQPVSVREISLQICLVFMKQQGTFHSRALPHKRASAAVLLLDQPVNVKRLTVTYGSILQQPLTDGSMKAIPTQAIISCFPSTNPRLVQNDVYLLIVPFTRRISPN